MQRRDFLKATIATTFGAGLFTSAGTWQMVVGEENIDQVDSFSWDTPPKMAHGEYVDIQGTLPLRTVLSNAILHPTSTVFLGESVWHERNEHWNCIRALRVCVPTRKLRGTCFELLAVAPVASKYGRRFYGGNGKTLEEVGKGLACPAAHLLRVTRDFFDSEWTMLTVTAIYPRMMCD